MAMILLMCAVSLLLASSAVAFTDVPAGHPYASAVADLSARGIINGYGDGRFGPDANVKRMQFAKMIDLTMDLDVTDADICPFPDVDPSQPGGLYPDHYVAVAARNEITRGYEDGTFRPQNPITRAQVITMIVRAADRLRPGLLAEAPEWYPGWHFMTDPTHGANIVKAGYNLILEGVDPSDESASWATSEPVTRGEVAQMLFNLSALWADYAYFVRPGAGARRPTKASS